MNKIILSVLFVVITLFSGFSQSQKGTVTSIDAKTPIANVVVTIGNTTAVTNDKGVFLIDVPLGENTIKLQVKGYKDVTKKIMCTSKTCPLTFLMKEDFEELHEVVVQGNVHGKNILKTTASVSEISATAIKETQTEQLNDLNSLIPNYVYSDLGVSYQQQITLRGVSAFSEVPSVATYIDGVNTFNISGNNLLLSDIEKITVYRGPQGALFGQDAIGGVINIVTKKPSNKQSVFLEANVGNQGLFGATYGFKAPLIKDKLFIGVSGKYRYQDGYYHNNLTGRISFQGESLDNRPENGARLGDYRTLYSDFYLRYKPNEKLDVLFNVKKQIDESVGASSLYQAVLSPEIAFEDPYVFAVSSLGTDERDLFNASLGIKYNFGNYNLSATSYYSKVKVGYEDIDGDISQFDFYTVSTSYKGVKGNSFPTEVIGQEFKFSSDTDKPLSWLVGGAVYFQDNKRQYTYYGNSFTEEYKDFQENTGLSGFGEITYKSSEKFKVSLDLRYDRDIKDIKSSVLETDDGIDSEITKAVNRKTTFDAFSPKLVFNYTPTYNSQLYASYARGFKSGGINNSVITDNEFSNYISEFSNVLEVGYKWLSEDRKYFMAVTAYGMYWENLQLYYFAQDLDTSGVWVIDNIGDVVSYGFEMEVTAKPFSGFKADFTLGTNYGEYEDFDFLGTNIKGNKTILSPDFTSFLGIQQEFSIYKKEEVTGSIRGEWRVVGDQYFDLINTIEQETYHLFNAQFSVKRKRMSLVFGVKNIFNKKYISFSMPGQFKATILNRPRTFKTSLIYRF